MLVHMLLRYRYRTYIRSSTFADVQLLARAHRALRCQYVYLLRYSASNAR
jgi:hypothetical protein